MEREREEEEEEWGVVRTEIQTRSLSIPRPCVDQSTAVLLWRVTRWFTARTGHAECKTERLDTENMSRRENIKHQEPFSENRFSPEIMT